MSKTIGILGAGSWGTALALSLSDKGYLVKIWDIDKDHLDAMRIDRENKKYLAGIKFRDNIIMANTAEEALEGVDLVQMSAPAQHFRSALEGALPFLKKDVPLVNVAKGIERKTLKRLSEVAKEIASDLPYVVLSGPTHAEEVSIGVATLLVSASEDLKSAEKVQDIYMSEKLRVYTNTDVIGVELAGALKNTIGLGAGIIAGMELGDNTSAALMTRGLAEIARLGEALGAQKETFMGLTGMGDLIVTCTSVHGRNRRAGILIGQGMSPEEATKKVGMVVEGMFTTQAAWQLAQSLGVEMPITEQIYRVINGEIDAREAVKQLMIRDRKSELE